MITLIRHYFKRTMVEPINLGIYILLPAALVLMNILIVGAQLGLDAELSELIIIDGYNIPNTLNSLIFLMFFQFFGASLIIDFLFLDFRGDRRWRLLSAPVSLWKYIFAAVIASTIFSVFAGLLNVAIVTIFFNGYLHNPFMYFGTIVVVALLNQFVGMLIFLLVSNKTTMEIIVQIFAWSMAAPMLFGIDLGTVGNNIIRYVTPLGMSIRAVTYSGFIGDDMGVALMNLGILVGITVVLAIMVIIVSRRKKF